MEQQSADLEGAKYESPSPSFRLPISYQRAIFLFLIGIVLGAMLKTQALHNITIGFDDYRLESLKSDYDLIRPKRAEAPRSTAPQNAPDQPPTEEPAGQPANR